MAGSYGVGCLLGTWLMIRENAIIIASRIRYFCERLRIFFTRLVGWGNLQRARATLSSRWRRMSEDTIECGVVNMQGYGQDADVERGEMAGGKPADHTGVDQGAKTQDAVAASSAGVLQVV